MQTAEKVRQDGQLAHAARIGTGSWLNENRSFDHDLRLPPDLKPYISALLDEVLQGRTIYKRESKERDLEILVSNLVNIKKLPVSFSLNRNDWTGNRYSKASYFTIELVQQLHERGFIDMQKGYRTEKESRLARIWATNKLLDYCPLVPGIVLCEPVELVILKDQDNRLKDYKDTAETKRIRQVLERVNKVNKQARIVHTTDRLSVYLYAVFREKFTLYGRLHSKGVRHYQGYSEAERAEFTIDGKPVVELDYSGLHPHLLYANEGIQFFGDPYSMVDDRPELRPFLKVILLAMLNAKDFVTAEKAANHWIRTKKNDEEKEEKRQAVRRAGVFKARPIMEAFAEVHHRIAHHFYNGKLSGLRIMNIDSKIALDIVDHFASLGIPILSVHDSFIVQAQHRTELLNTMKRTYQKWTNGFRCPIK